ncbi:MAG: ankyrin repeat domain-containing protein [Paracoccaceae bacterium]
MKNLELLALFQAEEEALEQAFKNQGLLKDDLNQERPQDVTEIQHDAFWLPDDVLCKKLKAYIEAGADADVGATDDRPSAFYHCFWYGKMASMRLLLGAGAQTEWTPDQVSLALGDVPATPRTGKADPFWFACRVGNFDAAREYLTKFDAGRNKSSDAVMAAVQARATDIVKWLMDLGFDPNAVDDINWEALERAVDSEDVATAEVLLAAGAAPLGSQEKQYTSPAQKAVTNEMRVLFVKHGVNPALFDYGPPMEDPNLSRLPETTLTKSDFEAHRTSRVGTSNPERFLPAFWSERMRDRGYSKLKPLGYSPDRDRPVWSFSRFGRTATVLPDGRLVLVAGEHEDHYDADFCIYADVTVLGTDGSVDHFIYPADVFPPTDFHSATLVGQHIWLIGCLGYPDQRKDNQTQVMRLSIEDFSISTVSTSGEMPGWIHGHRATLSEHGIVITGGKVEPGYVDNETTYLLNLETLVWKKIHRNGHSLDSQDQ